MSSIPKLINEPQPIYVVHDTYRRECAYIRGITISRNDFLAILATMPSETKMYFDFHNPRKEITAKTLLNGFNGLACLIYNYVKQQYHIDLKPLLDGKDFYVKITD